jgi:hypothetical protein
MPLAHPASAAAQRSLPAEELPLNTTLRHPGVQPEPGSISAAWFRLKVPEAGLLALDLTALGDPQAEPLLRLLTPASPAVGPGAATILRRTPTSALVAVNGAGGYAVEVAALDRDQTLPEFKLHASFLTLGSQLEVPIITEVDPWDDELDPKPGPGGNGAWLDELCSPGGQDDHGDTQLCATPLRGEEPVAGELQNDAGDDEDVFSFRLPVTTVIAIEAASHLALQVILRDRNGLALADARTEGGGDSVRLARALPAGRYFLEVEGVGGDSGAYALTLRQQD